MPRVIVPSPASARLLASALILRRLVVPTLPLDAIYAASAQLHFVCSVCKSSLPFVLIVETSKTCGYRTNNGGIHIGAGVVVTQRYATV
eukprot:650174-Prorocentrum_minimum.AAC.2